MSTEELLDKYDRLTKLQKRERALWNLLKANEKHIEELIEEDPTGFYFHKSFRQNDVCGNYNMDLAIWLLLNEAKLFWYMLENINTISWEDLQ